MLERMNADPQTLKMISEFQCPGCMLGSSPRDCEKYKYDSNSNSCDAHHPGTMAMGARGMVTFALGMPKMFNRVGALKEFKTFFYEFAKFMEEEAEHLPVLNMNVYKFYQNGYAFVKKLCPRINEVYIIVIACSEEEFAQIEAIHTLDEKFMEGVD